MAKRSTAPDDEAEIEVTRGSGNVFVDLGLPNPEERLAKAELSRVIAEVIRDREWSQKQAAEALGIATSDMSNVLRGKLRSFSQQRLERFLNVLDMEIRIQVGPRPAWKDRAGVTVERVASF